MLIPGLCGLAVIIGLVAIVMSRANWSVPQMVLMAGTLLGSLVFLYFAARTFVLAKNWNEELKKYVVAIDDVEHGKSQGNQILEKGIEQLRLDRMRVKHEVDVALADRGRVWHEANLVRANADTGEITATVDEPSPHGIEPKTTLFVFEQNDKEKGGKYLGEFTVTSAKDGDKQIKMLPSLALSQGELTEISRSRGHLDLYEIMPVDSHALFASLENRDELIKGAFGKDVQPAYLRDFAAATDADPKDRVYLWVKFTKEWSSDKVPAEKAAAPAAPGTPPAAAPVPVAAAATTAHVFKPGDVALFDPATAKDLVETKMVAEYDTNRDDKGKVFVRELRDYAQLFREATRRRTELTAQTAEVTGQAERIQAAQREVVADIAAIEKERDGLKKDLAKFQAEREAVTAFVAAVEKQNEALRAELSQTFRANIKMAAELDQLNHRLQEEINRRNPPVQSQASLAAPAAR
jgi:hypothetical protein